MDREIIDNIICEIMYADGPDGHVDGHEIIVDFIENLLEGKGSEWAINYIRSKSSNTLLSESDILNNHKNQMENHGHN